MRIGNVKLASIQEFVSILADFPVPIRPTPISSKPVSGQCYHVWRASGLLFR